MDQSQTTSSADASLNRPNSLQELKQARSVSTRSKCNSSNNLSRLLEDCRRLTIENFMLERYLQKVSPQSSFLPVRDSTDMLTSASRIRSKIHGEFPDDPPFVLHAKLLRLSNAQKCFIAHQEQSDLRKDISQVVETCESLLNDYTACVEKLRLIREDFARERKLFGRKVAAVVANPGECGDGHRALLSFHQGYLKRLDVSLRNLHLENENLRLTQKKIRHQLFERRMSGESATHIDKSYLQIKGSTLLEQLRNLSLQSLHAKILCNQCTRFCDFLKLQLTNSLTESASLQRATSRKQAIIGNLKIRFQEHKKLYSLDAQNAVHLSKRVEAYNTPTITDFVESVKKEQLLSKHLFICNRRMRIAKLSLERHRRIWAQVKQHVQNK